MDTEFDYITPIVKNNRTLWYYTQLNGRLSYCGYETREAAEAEWQYYKEDMLNDGHYGLDLDDYDDDDDDEDPF